MSTYVTKSYTIRPDVCRWHYRTSNASSSSGSFINKNTSNIWDNNTSSYAQIVDYDSPSSCWGVMSFRLNTTSLPANVRPQTITSYFKISYGSLASTNYYASASISSYNITFDEVSKTKPTTAFAGNATKSLAFDMSPAWESARSAIAANSLHLVFRLRCGSNLDTYRRFYELYATVVCQIYTFTVSVGTNIAEGGTVTGGGSYEDLSTATITATPNLGYEFAFWNDGDRNATRQITVTDDTTYTAYFRKLNYNIIAEASPSDGGTVTGSGNYEYGSQVALTATANDGMRFDHWSNGATTSQITVTVGGIATYIAYFVEATPIISSVTITPNPANTGQGFIIAAEVS